VRVGRTYVRMASSLKYLDLMLDSKLNLNDHFRYVTGKVLKVMRTLSRLMSNLRGPAECKKRLYANVLTSVVLYGAPIWRCFPLAREPYSVYKGLWQLEYVPPTEQCRMMRLLSWPACLRSICLP